MFGYKKLKKIRQRCLFEIQKCEINIDNDKELELYTAFQKGKKHAFESILRDLFNNNI